MRVVITGGAGFLGSHLASRLLSDGHSVVAVDDLSTGRRENVSNLLTDIVSANHTCPEFELEIANVANCMPFLGGPVDVVVHMASPASPLAYQAMPMHTLRTGSRGTENALDLAQIWGARFILASTSEVYGDPEVHPQYEGYWGNVNPIGPRSMYDEAKRFSEALTAAYARDGLNAGIVRIFNTYGPRMRADDGRVVTNFIVQTLSGQQLTLYGDGLQTRSLCFVDDLIDGIVRMIGSNVTGPINIGNPREITIDYLADTISRIAGVPTPSVVRLKPAPDDPQRRCPDISMAKQHLGWSPRTSLEDGLIRTIRWFRARPDEVRSAAERFGEDRQPDIAAR
jgi:dTDP-glucose 4,6-dehydratase